jgi:hypothetical protein
MTRYSLTLKYLSGVPDAYSLNSESFLALTGYNVGNLVFRKVLDSILADLREFSCITFADLKSNPCIYEDADVVVVSCANWLGMREGIEKSNIMRAELIDKFKCPVIAFGLGVQASEAQQVNLGPNTLALAQVLSKKNRFLSVRDHLTADVLRAKGILNAVVTGCPSNFINLGLSLSSFDAALKRHVSISQWNSVGCMVSEATMGHSLSKDYIAAVFNILTLSPSKYVLQVGALLKFLMLEEPSLPVNYLGIMGMDESQIKFLVRDKVICFSSVDEWMFSARSFDLSFGMRMHGTMVALQAGVPSILVTHDRRTAELGKTMEIPRLTIDNFLVCMGSGPDLLFQAFRDSLSEYFRKRDDLAMVFAKYMDDSCLRVSPGFSSFLNRELRV